MSSATFRAARRGIDVEVKLSHADCAAPLLDLNDQANAFFDARGGVDTGDAWATSGSSLDSIRC